MAEEVKRKALVFLFSALVITALIGVGLPRLKFQPGMPLPSFENGQVVALPSEDGPPVAVSVNTFFLILVLILLAGFLLIQVYRLIKGVNWKKLLSESLPYIFYLLIVLGIFFLAINLLPKSRAPTYAEPVVIPKPTLTAPLGPVPPLLIWLVAIGLLGCAAILGIWMIVSRRQCVPNPWELELEKARLAILSGQDLKNVILVCYQRMSLALQQEQKIEREAFMTTGEFERLLAEKGVPQDPVHQLTQLFDAIRYGHWQPDASDEKRALGCLDAILEYSHQARQGSSDE